MFTLTSLKLYRAGYNPPNRFIISYYNRSKNQWKVEWRSYN